MNMMHSHDVAILVEANLFPVPKFSVKSELIEENKTEDALSEQVLESQAGISSNAFWNQVEDASDILLYNDPDEDDRENDA